MKTLLNVIGVVCWVIPGAIAFAIIGGEQSYPWPIAIGALVVGLGAFFGAALLERLDSIAERLGAERPLVPVETPERPPQRVAPPTHSDPDIAEHLARKTEPRLSIAPQRDAAPGSARPPRD